ncbi:MAG: hypothetical protein PW786_06735 [Arachidicoccus sp.]|nr:hypothetical protein [Arachidicoccus sp.]
MKVLIMLIFSIGTLSSFASFSIANDLNFDKIKDKEKGKAKEEKYSLRNIHRPASFFSLSSGNDLSKINTNFTFFPENLPIINNNTTEQNNSSENELQVNSLLRINTGNSIVVYPFNIKVKSTPLGLFKTPSAPTR